MEIERNPMSEEQNTTEEPTKEGSSKNPVLYVVVIVVVLLGVYFIFSGTSEEEAMVEETPTEEAGGTVNNVPPRTSSGGDESAGIPAMDALTVRYTNEGFSPFLLEINAGDTVNFVNDSQGTMWVTSEAHPTADQHYPEFGMSKSISPGETYEFQFTLEGSWGYKNLNNEKHLGAIIVMPQKQQ